MNKILNYNTIKNILDDRVKEDKFLTLKDLPKPNNFKDIKKATTRIIKAINSKETINLVGDYDADGICSTAIMVLFFKQLNIDINHIIPNRFTHGYGLSPMIMDLIDDGLIITVDNGISAMEASQIATKRGLDLIITDHHTVGVEVPKCYAIINPKQDDCTFPFSDICGAQVAWYLCASIKKELNLDYNLIALFDILCIAIVADIMPMLSLNKTMVKAGLKELSLSKRPAFLALKKRFGFIKINEEDIGFKIAPLINCAGRMGDPNIALEFILADNLSDADQQLDYLIELNEQRKFDQLQIFNEAKEQVNDNINDDVVLVASEKWNEGIVGIVASKLCEKYKKPAFVFAKKGDISKASSRSDTNTHLYDLIASCSQTLLGFGGHKQAAGMSIKTQDLELFRTQLNTNIKLLNINNIIDNTPVSMGRLNLIDVDEPIYNLIESYRPFGAENNYPVFLFNNIKVINMTKMGKNKEFKKLIVADDYTQKEVVIFTDIDDILPNTIINFTATISKNEFRGDIKYNLLFKEKY